MERPEESERPDVPEVVREDSAGGADGVDATTEEAPEESDDEG